MFSNGKRKNINRRTEHLYCKLKIFFQHSFRNKMVLMHGDEKDVEEVPFLPNYYAKFERCYAWSPLTDQEVCLRAEYPNVTTSTSHAYFPLSGPFFASIFRKNRYLHVYKSLRVYFLLKDWEWIVPFHCKICLQIIFSKWFYFLKSKFIILIIRMCF